MKAPRGVLPSGVRCLLAAACVGLLAWETQRPRPGTELVLQPVAPPLTRIASLGDAPLMPEPDGAGVHPHPPGGRVPLPSAVPPPNGAPSGAPTTLGHTLRLHAEADAIALVALLGTERVDAAVTHRETLSALLGESRTWDDLLASLEARAAEEPQ